MTTTDGLKCWTNYPKPDCGYDGKMRQVEVVTYDGDKYILTSNGEVFKVGVGYLYRNRRKVRYKVATIDRRIPLGDVYTGIIWRNT